MFFLSASIPDPKRNERYYGTADIIAIRDAVRALATVVIPKSHLVWGGHPAITPLIREVLFTMNTDVNKHVTLYQSEFFRNQFPDDNKYIEKVIVVPASINREESLLQMRIQMFMKKKFSAAIFIGGMEGAEDEYKLFKEYHPNVKLLPIASTGAAAKILYENYHFNFDERLVNDYAYMSLFKSLLGL